jgi:hypothetical protein
MGEHNEMVTVCKVGGEPSLEPDQLALYFGIIISNCEMYIV